MAKSVGKYCKTFGEIFCMSGRLRFCTIFTKHKPGRLILLILFLFALVIVKATTNDISIKCYTKKLEDFCGVQMIGDQRSWIIREYMKTISVQKPSRSRTKRTRKMFNLRRDELKMSWSRIYAKPWPRDENNKNYQAHHIIPISCGGVNHVYNIVPLNEKSHIDIHRSLEIRACFGSFFDSLFCRLILVVKFAWSRIFTR